MAVRVAEEEAYLGWSGTSGLGRTSPPCCTASARRASTPSPSPRSRPSRGFGSRSCCSAAPALASPSAWFASGRSSRTRSDQPVHRQRSECRNAGWKSGKDGKGQQCGMWKRRGGELLGRFCSRATFVLDTHSFQRRKHMKSCGGDGEDSDEKEAKKKNEG